MSNSPECTLQVLEMQGGEGITNVYWDICAPGTPKKHRSLTIKAQTIAFKGNRDPEAGTSRRRDPQPGGEHECVRHGQATAAGTRQMVSESVLHLVPFAQDAAAESTYDGFQNRNQHAHSIVAQHGSLRDFDGQAVEAVEETMLARIERRGMPLRAEARVAVQTTSRTLVNPRCRSVDQQVAVRRSRMMDRPWASVRLRRKPPALS